jgi:glycosyltransferase involved in cell wall biosynthesis
MPHLLSINSYHYRRGGADAVYLDHAALMESIGWRNTFFSMRHPDNLPCETSEYFVDEIQIGHDYTLAQKAIKATQVIYSLQARRRLSALIRARQPDIAHVHNIYHHLSPSILPLLGELGIPAVMTAHDLKIACPNNKMLNAGGVCERCKGGRYHQAVLNRCVHGSVAASSIVALESTLHHVLGSYRRNLERILVPSRFFIDKFVEWGWERRLFAHVPNFVDAAAFEPRFEAGTYVVYFGRLALEKGLLTLVRAAALADVPLVLVGTGPLESELRSLAARLSARIEFAGYRTGAALYDIVRGARATVLASEWYENAPISVLESLALGKPVVGARIGGIPEMVRDGETGWLFDSGSAEGLAAALRDAYGSSPSRLEALGRQGRRMVEVEFSRARYLESVLDIYQGVLGRRPSALPRTAADHV